MIHPGIDKVIELLREAGEERFDMSRSCGSPCCIGGHCNNLLAKRGFPQEEIEQALSIVSGIPVNNADDICFPSGRSGFCPKSMEVHYTDITLSDAIAVLEHYRDTGIVDWSPVSQRLEREAV